MVARHPGEAQRTSTPLELLFDLCFVVAVSQAAACLHHALAEGHPGSGVLNYLLVFFAIWWAWMNVTWFASAYDTDDGLYRVTTLVQIAGGLVLAAGVTPAAQTHDLTVITVGYVIMRLAMVAQWLRAAKGDPPGRKAALFFAGGIAVVQAGWICRLALPQSLFLTGFAVLAACELLVPVLGERLAPTTWHPRHIAERYGCFTLIVLGESVLSATMAIQTGLAAHEHVRGLAWLAIAGLVIVFSMWWLYFDQPAHQHLTSLRKLGVRAPLHFRRGCRGGCGIGPGRGLPETRGESVETVGGNGHHPSGECLLAGPWVAPRLSRDEHGVPSLGRAGALGVFFTCAHRRHRSVDGPVGGAQRAASRAAATLRRAPSLATCHENSCQWTRATGWLIGGPRR